MTDSEIIASPSRMPFSNDPQWSRLTLYDRRVLGQLRADMADRRRPHPRDVARLMVLVGEMGARA